MGGAFGFGLDGVLGLELGGVGAYFTVFSAFSCFSGWVLLFLGWVLSCSYWCGRCLFFLSVWCFWSWSLLILGLGPCVLSESVVSRCFRWLDVDQEILS